MKQTGRFIAADVDNAPANVVILPPFKCISAIALMTSVWETVEGGPVAKYFEGREFY